MGDIEPGRWNDDLEQQNAALVAELADERTRLDQLRRTNEQLVQADQRKNDFLTTLSHELRNPLAPIRNSLYVLERAEPGGPQARHATEVISRQTEHMTRLVDELLDVSRISRGKIRLERERVRLCEIVARVAEDQRLLFERNGVTLDVNQQWGVVVDGDPTRLAQVVANLLQNAAKFTPTGGRTEVALTVEGNQAVLCVRDNGVGISSETLPHLFEPFTQGARSEGAPGLGLGLALVKGFVELHGGTVDAASEGPGRGAEFTVRLPAQAPAQASAQAPQPGTKPAAARVLVIEDNRDAAESLKEALELGAHEVAIAGDGASGLEVAHEFHPQVVLCDIGLPIMDGYEVARRMRCDPELRALYLVALSGYASQEDAQHARAVGFDRHMAKPPNMDVLEKLLAGLL